MAKYGIPGLSAAVLKSGEDVQLKGYGLASVELDVPARENSVYQIYSATKAFAGIALMMLVEEGRLSLETPVTEILDYLPPTWKEIRVRHLPTHTSGLPEKQDSPRFN